MTPDDARRLVDDALRDVAPELDPTDLGPEDPLRDTARLDSFDFLHLLAAIDERCELTIPEADYPRVGTYRDLVAYVAAAVESRR